MHGGVANQNRGTIGGNIVNASPAADSLPALLVHDAALVLVSVRGERRVPYADFHTGYKKMRLAKDELIRSICLPRRFSKYFSYARKVGARNAQAISKVCIAALGVLGGGVIEEARIAMGSVAPVPLRLTKTEEIVRGKIIGSDLLMLARNSARSEIQPIDDIRSNANYRATVAGNLVAEFLSRLKSAQTDSTNKHGSAVLARWNRMPIAEAAHAIFSCCGSKAWSQKIAARRPVVDEAGLREAADQTWRNLAQSDWIEAFNSHPRIGDSRPSQLSSQQSVEWSAQEQRQVAAADTAGKMALAEANREYERRFNRVFIVCASGKPVEEILEILRRRLKNDAETELQEAAEQQRQIMQIRIGKWLQE